MRKSLIAIGLALACALPAAAQEHVGGTITSLRTGWNADSFGVVLNSGQINPARCSAGNLGYISSSDQPGYNTYYAAALTAYVARKQVTVVVHASECIGPFPKIIGINLP